MYGAIVLAGGKSRRMGKNKALIDLGGKPLIRHVVERASRLAGEVVVVGSGESLDRYSSILPPSARLLTDPVEGGGPMLGIATGMKGMRAGYALVLPCDTPFLQVDVLRCLVEKAEGMDAAIPRWPDGNLEPLLAAYRVAPALAAAESALSVGELSILDMIRRLDSVAYVSTAELERLDPDLKTFFNINRMEDLLIAERMLTLEPGLNLSERP